MPTQTWAWHPAPAPRLNKLLERQGDRLTELRAAGDRLGELHVRDAGLERRQLDRRTVADRPDEVGLDLPGAGLLGRDGYLRQFFGASRRCTVP